MQKTRTRTIMYDKLNINYDMRKLNYILIHIYTPFKHQCKANPSL